MGGTRLNLFILFIALTQLHLGLGRKFQWEDDDTIITEATREEDLINAVLERQDIPNSVPVRIFGVGGGPQRSRDVKRTCYSTHGDMGMCSTFKSCFPMLYYTDDEHMGELKHPALAEMLMSTSGPCDPLPFSFRDDFPGHYTPVAEDVSDLICCPNMKPEEPTKKPQLAKKASTTTRPTTSTTPRSTTPYVYVPDAVAGMMMSLEVMPPKSAEVDKGEMIPMSHEVGDPDSTQMQDTGVVRPSLTEAATTVYDDDDIETTTQFPPTEVDIDVETTVVPVPVVEVVEVVEEPEPLPQMLNAPCGQINSSRDPSQPWVVAIKLDSKYICSGSVIDSYHVLTSAHCVAHLTSLDVGRLRVYLGEKILNSNLDGPMVIRKVYRAMHHRGYSMSSMEDDIGLLKLNLPIPIKTNRVKPICLPTEDSDLDGMQSSIVGWGPRWNDVPNDYLLENRFRIWSNSACSNAYKFLTPTINITDSMVCAQYYHVKPKEMSSYYDVDSGGSPVVVQTKDGRIMQVGIYSWRLRSSSAFPYVLTRVSAFPKWIQKNRLRK